MQIIQQRDKPKGLPCIGRCVCGFALELEEFTSTCRCGRDYNRSGEELAPRIGHHDPSASAFRLTVSEQSGYWAGRGPVVSSHPTSQTAFDALVEYVRRNWDEEMGLEDWPDDPNEAVDRYFAEVPETYEIRPETGA